MLSCVKFRTHIASPKLNETEHKQCNAESLKLQPDSVSAKKPSTCAFRFLEVLSFVRALNEHTELKTTRKPKEQREEVTLKNWRSPSGPPVANSHRHQPTTLGCRRQLNCLLSLHLLFVIEKGIYCICCGVRRSSGVFCCPRVLILIRIHFVLCSCLLSSIVFFRRWIFVVSSKYHLLFLLHFSSFFGCLLLSLPPRFELYSFSSMQLFIFECLLSLHLRFVIEKAFIVLAAVFFFLRVSSAVLALSFWFEFILIYVAVFYLRLSSVVESSLSNPSIIYCFCCISHLSSGVFCCHFLLVSYCIQFVPCSCRLSSIASCHCISVLILKKAFIVFAAVFVFLRVSSVVLAFSFWFEFILFPCSCLLSSIVFFCHWVFVAWSK